MINHKAYVKPKHGNWINQQEYIAVKSVVADAAPQTTDTSALDAQISLLQGQVVQLTSQITTLQAQATQDAVTIAALQGQVVSLNSQITALQNQLAAYTKFGTYFYGAVTLHTTGGVYVPPSFNDTTINVSVLKSPLIWGPVTRTGGGYP